MVNYGVRRLKTRKVEKLGFASYRNFASLSCSAGSWQRTGLTSMGDRLRKLGVGKTRIANSHHPIHPTSVYVTVAEASPRAPEDSLISCDRGIPPRETVS